MFWFYVQTVALWVRRRFGGGSPRPAGGPPQCCYIHRFGAECTAPGAWWVWESAGGGPDDYSFACDAHAARMTPDGGGRWRHGLTDPVADAADR